MRAVYGLRNSLQKTALTIDDALGPAGAPGCKQHARGFVDVSWVMSSVVLLITTSAQNPFTPTSYLNVSFVPESSLRRKASIAPVAWEPTTWAKSLIRAASAQAAEVPLPKGVRLLGVSLSSLSTDESGATDERQMALKL